MVEAKQDVTTFLERVARSATDLMNLEERRLARPFTIALAPATDITMMWKCAALHPLQPLQNVHQRIVRQLTASETDGEKRQFAESTLLGKFYLSKGLIVKSPELEMMWIHPDLDKNSLWAWYARENDEVAGNYLYHGGELVDILNTYTGDEALDLDPSQTGQCLNCTVQGFHGRSVEFSDYGIQAIAMSNMRFPHQDYIEDIVLAFKETLMV